MSCRPSSRRWTSSSSSTGRSERWRAPAPISLSARWSARAGSSASAEARETRAAENQEQADERIPHLLNVPARVRFLSCEPLLGPIDLSHFANSGGEEYGIQDGGVHWVICGGESFSNNGASTGPARLAGSIEERWLILPMGSQWFALARKLRGANWTGKNGASFRPKHIGGGTPKLERMNYNGHSILGQEGQIMKKINPANLRNLEAQARAIGKTVDGAINPPDPATGKRRRRNGFALLLFSFEGPELTWISNGARDDMIKVLEEMLSRFKTGRMDDFPGGVDASN